jgi:hypothetical protein
MNFPLIHLHNKSGSRQTIMILSSLVRKNLLHLFIAVAALHGIYSTFVTANPISSLCRTDTGLATVTSAKTDSTHTYVPLKLPKRELDPPEVIYISISICIVLILVWLGASIIRGDTCVTHNVHSNATACE